MYIHFEEDVDRSNFLCFIRYIVSDKSQTYIKESVFNLLRCLYIDLHNLGYANSDICILRDVDIQN